MKKFFTKGRSKGLKRFFAAATGFREFTGNFDHAVAVKCPKCGLTTDD